MHAYYNCVLYMYCVKLPIIKYFSSTLRLAFTCYCYLYSQYPFLSNFEYTTSPTVCSKPPSLWHRQAKLPITTPFSTRTNVKLEIVLTRLSIVLTQPPAQTHLLYRLYHRRTVHHHLHCRRPTVKDPFTLV